MSIAVESIAEAYHLIGTRVAVEIHGVRHVGKVVGCGFDRRRRQWMGIWTDGSRPGDPGPSVLLPCEVSTLDSEPDGTQRPAMEALVRTTVRSALDHAGARVPFTMKETEPGAWAVEARRAGQWVVNSGVDGSTFTGLQQTADAFAREVALAMEVLGQCPTCQTFPMLCEFHGAANTRGIAAKDECDALVRDGPRRLGTS